MKASESGALIVVWPDSLAFVMPFVCHLGSSQFHA